jgi:hypothetical protein
MRIVKGLLIVLAVFALAACASSAPSSSFPTGEYKDFAGWPFTFHADGKLTLETTFGVAVYDNGSYSVEGDVIRFIDSGCGETLMGVYNWRVDEDGVLQFVLINDECSIRRDALMQGLEPVR